MILFRSLSGGPGLHDPCEKEPTNTLSAMTDEEAEAVTYNAQVCEMQVSVDDREVYVEALLLSEVLICAV